MPLAAGTRLGPYEIAAALGAGGMGKGRLAVAHGSAPSGVVLMSGIK